MRKLSSSLAKKSLVLSLRGKSSRKDCDRRNYCAFPRTSVERTLKNENILLQFLWLISNLLDNFSWWENSFVQWLKVEPCNYCNMFARTSSPAERKTLMSSGQRHLIERKSFIKFNRIVMQKRQSFSLHLQPKDYKSSLSVDRHSSSSRILIFLTIWLLSSPLSIFSLPILIAWLLLRQTFMRRS